MATITEIQLKIKSANPFEANAKKNILINIANLSMEQLQLINEFITPYALQKLKENQAVLKSFLS